MYLIDKWGIEKFREEVENIFECGGTLPTNRSPKDEFLLMRPYYVYIRKKQPGLNFAGLHIPLVVCPGYV